MVRRTRYSLVNHETRLEARNDSWTFETVRATHGTKGMGRYVFEVVLATDGLMQVGWVNDAFEVDPEAGRGVGDDSHSYGYDGRRVKKWHAQDNSRVS